MIAALRRAAAYSGRLIEAARTAGTLARTVRVLSRQLDHMHLLAASEECRADRAEERVAELELQLADWREASGELVAEEEAADLRDAGEEARSPLPSCTCHEADIQRGRAEQAERERDANARAAGAHIKTIAELRAQLAEALRAVHRPASAEQIPGVAAARTLSRLECSICPYVARELDEEAGDKCPACGSKLAEVESCDACGKPVRDGERTGEAEAVLLCGRCRAKAEAEEAARTSATLTLAAHGNDPQRGTAATAAYRATIEAARATAGTEIEPPTRPSERAATRTT